MKGLVHKEHFDGIISGKFLPPYCVCTDPSNYCNQACIYCNSKQYKSDYAESYMPEGHLLKLASFYKDWGIQSTIIEGGGEPLTNPETIDFIKKCYDYEIETGLITNGSLIDNNLLDICDMLRFIGISFDAGSAKTYEKIRGIQNFKTVCHNVYELNKHKKICDVNMKFLIHPLNYKEIYTFVALAKNLGCNGAHIKPVATKNIIGIDSVDLSPYIKEINKQIERTRQLEDESFSVYSVMYKFDNNMQHQIKFTKCDCTPIGGVFGADGNFWLCFNSRGVPGFRLGSHYPDPYNIKRLWSTKLHKKLINNININNCMRCGLTAYNEIIENCIKQDKLFWKFL